MLENIPSFACGELYTIRTDGFEVDLIKLDSLSFLSLDNTIAVRTVQVTEKSSDQRLDNFLLRELKGVPRTRIYRLIRRGEVRVNKKRAKPETRPTVGDKVRIPPLHLPDSPELPKPSPGLIWLLEQSILHEDDNLLVLNKPAGWLYTWERVSDSG